MPQETHPAQAGGEISFDDVPSTLTSIIAAAVMALEWAAPERIVEDDDLAGQEFDADERCRRHGQIQEIVDAALATRGQTPACGVIPDGWQLVPKVPTDRMRAAMARACTLGWDIGHYTWEQGLANAPAPPLVARWTVPAPRETIARTIYDAAPLKRWKNGGDRIVVWDDLSEGEKSVARKIAEAILALPALAATQPVPASREAGGLIAYLTRQWAWSKETFGPALRTRGIVQHITRELREIEAAPHDLAEWVDVIILAMDGFWRHGGKPADLLTAMQAKQDRNFARTWPDWRTMGEDQAIEHDRSGEPVTSKPEPETGGGTALGSPGGEAPPVGWPAEPFGFSTPTARPLTDAERGAVDRDDLYRVAEAEIEKWLDWCDANDEEPEGFSGARLVVNAILASPDSTPALAGDWNFAGGHVRKAIETTEAGEKHIGAEVCILVTPGQENQLPEMWRSMAASQMPPSTPGAGDGEGVV